MIKLIKYVKMLIEAKINWLQRTSEPIVARPAEPRK